MKLKFGIIGCGRIAERHAEHINNLGELVAVCDIKPERLEVFQSKYNCRTYLDISDFLDKEKSMDVVSVCSPNGLHHDHSVMALRKGFHVLCEKPMAINVVDSEHMINESLKANRRLFVVKQNRFNPPVQAVKQAIDDSRFGKIYSVQLNCFWNRNPKYYSTSDWKGTLKLDGGTLFTQFSHFIDLLYYFFGDVSEAKGFSGNFDHQGIIEFEDSGMVAIKFYNGILGTINYTVNSYEKNMEGSITIFREKGTVKIGGQYLNELEYQHFHNYEIKDLPPGNPPNNYGEYKGSMSNHDQVYANVIDVLQNQGVIATNGFEGLKIVEIIDKIYKAIR
ncbi:MAG: Gfo/Idh/MocA family oxidoreductase [Cyclobacteriaceae bacterium]|nr:Gfo/Idh/MocA family oxidoreductase [Cyclobacteriaceae bacterium]